MGWPAFAAPGPEETPHRPSEVRSIVTCCRRVREAEAALALARDALFELDISELDEFRPSLKRTWTYGGLQRGAHGVYHGSGHGPTFAEPAPGGPSGTGSTAATGDDCLGSEGVKLKEGYEPAVQAAAEAELAPWLVDQIVLTSLTHPPVVDGAGSERRTPVDTVVTNRSSDCGSVDDSIARRRKKKEEFQDADIIWEDICGGLLKMPMVHPEARFRLFWLTLGFVFIIYEAFAVPVYLAFNVDATGYLFVQACVINVYFISDVCFQFTFCHLDKNGLPVTRPSRVAKGYVAGWLIPDLIASIPWEWLELSADTSGAQFTRSVRVIRALRLVRLMRLVKIARLGPYMDQLETKTEANHVYTFILGVCRVGGILLTVCHWSACMWYAIGANSTYKESNYPEELPSTWLGYYQQNYPFIGEEKSHHYVYAFYYTLTTMATVGYGDFAPKNYDEVRFTLGLLVVSSVLFASLMGTLMDMIGKLNAQSHMLAEKKVMLSRYMTWRDVPWKLMRSIRQYLLFMWDANEGWDAYEEGLKHQLPPVLKGELCFHIYGHIITLAPFMAWMRDYPVATKYLAEKIHSIFLETDDHVFRMGQPNEQIYMLVKGLVMISRNEKVVDYAEVWQPIPGAEDIMFEIPRKKGMKLVATGTDSERGTKLSMQAKKAYGLRTTGVSQFDSEVLTMAMVELRRDDMRRQRAARLVQRRWRHNRQIRLLREAAGLDAPTATKPVSANRLKINRIQSRNVSAPAYFGEACLWQPHEEWGSSPPPTYIYSVRCLMRTELVYIPRVAIKDLLKTFSPWLPERLDIFRAAVIERLQHLIRGDEDLFQTIGLDWTAADFCMPSDETGLNAVHTQALAREEEKPVPSPVLLKVPASRSTSKMANGMGPTSSGPRPLPLTPPRPDVVPGRPQSPSPAPAMPRPPPTFRVQGDEPEEVPPSLPRAPSGSTLGPRISTKTSTHTRGATGSGPAFPKMMRSSSSLGAEQSAAAQQLGMGPRPSAAAKRGATATSPAQPVMMRASSSVEQAMVPRATGNGSLPAGVERAMGFIMEQRRRNSSAGMFAPPKC